MTNLGIPFQIAIKANNQNIVRRVLSYNIDYVLLTQLNRSLLQKAIPCYLKDSYKWRSQQQTIARASRIVVNPLLITYFYLCLFWYM